MNTPFPEITHSLSCKDPTVRASESLWQRGVIRYRCLGCGARADVRPGGDLIDPRPNQLDREETA